MDFNNKCVNCKKSIHCCIFKNDSGFTFIGIKDAKKIKKEINKPYSYFLNYSTLPKKIVTSLKQDEDYQEGNLRFSQLTKQNKILKLNTKNEGRCIFLDDKNKCKIYNIRPNICKMYPFWALRLTNNKLKIIQHDTNSRCQVLKQMSKKQKDIEKTMTKNEIKNIQIIFKQIEQENKYYKKNINNFVKKLNL
ncbi:MAG: YkgJ family cysteine cluster protein [Candidatus Woesearchaeota archaeon]|jgi:Fe-S-cluster containining protein